jgi:hypothetical protein
MVAPAAGPTARPGRRWFTLGKVICASVVLYLVWCLASAYRGVYHCTECGLKRVTVEVPWISDSLGKMTRMWSREESTAVYELLVKEGVVGSHTHKWVFAHGRGMWEKSYGIGEAYTLIGVVNNPDVCALMREARRLFGSGELRRLVKVMGNREGAEAIRTAALLRHARGELPSAEEAKEFLDEYIWLLGKPGG